MEASCKESEKINPTAKPISCRWRRIIGLKMNCRFVGRIVNNGENKMGTYFAG